MNNKLIKKLAWSCFEKGVLDEVKVLKVAKYLNKKQLRAFVKNLKLIDKQNTVTVFVSNKKLNKLLKKQVDEIFKGKKIIVKEDKELIAGIRIEDFDNTYELNLKNTIANIVNYINE